MENHSNLVIIFAGELNELVREKDLLSLERKCEHHATETAINNAREMQKQAAKSAKDAGKNKGIFFIESCKLDSKQRTREDRWGGRGSLMKNLTNIAGLSCILLHIAGKITGICHKRLILIQKSRPKSEHN